MDSDSTFFPFVFSYIYSSPNTLLLLFAVNLQECILFFLLSSEFFLGDRVPFSASDSGSLWKCTNESQSLPHFFAKKNSLLLCIITFWYIEYNIYYRFINLLVHTLVYHIFIHFNNFLSILTNPIHFSFIFHPTYLHYIMLRK